MRRLLAWTIAVACVAFHSAASGADEIPGVPVEASTEQVERCVSQHDSARQLRLAEHWLEARVAMTACAADRCPLAISADCRAWLEELNRTLPTLLVLIEREDGLPARPSSVELDGQAVQLPDPPAPIELLPGPHRLRVIFAGRAPIEWNFVLKKGEKNQLARVRLAALPAGAPPPSPKRRAPPPVPPARPVPTATYLLSAGALAAFAGSTALLVSAVHERSDARESCAPACDPTVRRSIETRLVLADVSAGAGFALGALALYTFVQRPTLKAAAQLSGPAVLASEHGFGLVWQGQF
jgi:hypothetical protein